MSKFKRPLFLFLLLEDIQSLDLVALLQGKVQECSQSRLAVLSTLTSRTVPLSLSELEVLCTLPTDRWVLVQEMGENFSEIAPQRLAELVSEGVLLCDAADPEAQRLLERAETIERLQWHPRAAFHHATRRGPENTERIQALELSEYEELFTDPEKKAAAFVAENGRPPELFYRREECEVIDLPLQAPEGDLYERLRHRSTSRRFDLERSLPLADFSALLQTTFCYSGWARLSSEVKLVRRTSPSGGSRHPIEAYPLVQNVEGLQNGIYHYDSSAHRLERIEAFSLEESQDFLLQASQGQSWITTAHSVVFLTARFFKNFWKYRKNYRTYDVILMDAGHLSQTFYLTADQLGLGAFYTGAINAPLIDQRLKIDGFEEGSLAVCGCGVRLEEDEMQLHFQNFIPRQTNLD